MAFMKKTEHITERRLADAWAELQNHSDLGNPLEADAYRLAFADPEFLLRRETRGIRFQLEMLKPDLDRPNKALKILLWCLAARAFLRLKMQRKACRPRS
jgi:hypothetical protein